MACTTKALTRFATNIIIYCDNKTAIDILLGKIPKTSKKEVYKIWKIQSEWEKRDRLAHIAAGGIFGIWIQVHCGNLGNEEADSLARAGAQIANQTSITDNPSHLAVKKSVQIAYQTLIAEWWEKHAPTRYKTLRIKVANAWSCPTELSLSRLALGKLIASRTGHGDFKASHEHFRHVDFQNCECGEDKAPDNFFFCRKTRGLTKKQVGNRRGEEAIRWLLGTTEGAIAFGRIFK